MQTLLIILPFCISFMIGLFLIRLLCKNDRLNLFFEIFLALGIGLGLSSYITLFSFYLFNQLNALFVVVTHLIFFLLLLFKCIQSQSFKNSFTLNSFKNSSIDIGLLATFCCFAIPFLMIAHFYPFGGWDAWQVWNFKARMLLLGAENWTNMFDPKLWRSSPHYPLLLPLINVWGWIFVKYPSNLSPIITACMYTIASAGICVGGLMQLYKSRLSILLGILCLSFPLFLKLSAGQYSDICFAYYSSASIICLIAARKQSSISLAVISAFLAGFLSFTKPEGMIASLLITLLFIPYMFWNNHTISKRKFFLTFYSACALIFAPSIFFYLFYAPSNITFINGLLSSTNPSTFMRFKIIAGYLFFEVINWKWSGIWILSLGGILISGRKLFSRSLLVIPCFLSCYLGIVLFYYFLNTYFEIVWWLNVSLNRILASLLPLTLFWSFSLILKGSKHQSAKSR